MLRIDRYWHSLNPVAIVLFPLAVVFGVVVTLRRWAYRLRLRRVSRFPVPVIVVGNITVGGTGKTPLVIWLADYLARQGWRPGIVSRGYGGGAQHWPQQVRADSDPAVVGDEAVMLAARTRRPMCVGPDRPSAVAALLAHTDTNIVISDDGLQHYALGRDIEIAVVDGERRLGNGLLMPAGPLRERAGRLRRVDLVVVNGQGGEGEYSMKIHQPGVRSLHGDTRQTLEAFAGRSVHAVAGVGNPQRFFDLLRRHRVTVNEHVFADHHAFVERDLALEPALPILMTEKDAVKCRRLACRDCWVVQVDAQPDAAFVLRLNSILKEISDGQEASGHPRVPDL
ncbi:MAG: tetraacyldisaccharide 4'-kinase [Gammaproteobacteria bacterium]|nr:tetraacyldisaccharide 4'-kinase [Gammaproteobacteria bacterium]